MYKKKHGLCNNKTDELIKICNVIVGIGLIKKSIK